MQRSEELFAAGILEEIRVRDPEEVRLFAQLIAIGLGVGECSAIAVAAHRKLPLAIDDKRAIKKLKKPGLGLTILTTESLHTTDQDHARLSLLEHPRAATKQWTGSSMTAMNHSFRLWR